MKTVNCKSLAAMFAALALLFAGGVDSARATVVAAAWHATAAAQDDEQPPAIELPASAATTDEFVPRGWRMETETDDALAGDLDGDRIADRVLRLVQDSPVESPDGTMRTRFRALVVLLGKPGGGFTRAAVSTRLLLCSTCAGVRGDPSSGGNIQVRVERGVIVVGQQSGSRWAYDHTLRFRHDRATNRFLLIGEDFDNHDTATGERTNDSTNYLTGVKLTRKFRYDKWRDDEALVSEKTTRVPRGRKSLEDVDYNNP